MSGHGLEKSQRHHLLYIGHRHAQTRRGLEHLPRTALAIEHDERGALARGKPGRAILQRSFAPLGFGIDHPRISLKHAEISGPAGRSTIWNIFFLRAAGLRFPAGILYCALRMPSPLIHTGANYFNPEALCRSRQLAMFENARFSPALMNT